MKRKDDIPADIKLVVRKRDGFGCVVCGGPLYEYEHFVEYSKIRRHTVENIYLACDSHHRKKGALWSRDAIKAARLNPHNIANPESRPEQLRFHGASYTLAMGTCELIIDDGRPSEALRMNGDSIVDFATLPGGGLLLGVLLQDRSGNELLKIVESEVVVNTVDNWDVEWSPTSTIHIRHRKKKVSLRIVFDADQNRVHIQSGKLHYGGRLVEVLPATVSVDGNVIDGQRSHNSDIMLSVGTVPDSGESCSTIII